MPFALLNGSHNKNACFCEKRNFIHYLWYNALEFFSRQIFFERLDQPIFIDRDH